MHIASCRVVSAAFTTRSSAPRFQARPGAQIDLSYVTQHQESGGQTAEVSIVWDTGRTQLLTRYDQTFGGPESLTATAPADATGFEIRFAYSGANDWFWALDQVDVSVAGGTPRQSARTPGLPGRHRRNAACGAGARRRRRTSRARTLPGGAHHPGARPMRRAASHPATQRSSRP